MIDVDASNFPTDPFSKCVLYEVIFFVVTVFEMTDRCRMQLFSKCSLSMSAIFERAYFTKWSFEVIFFEIAELLNFNF